MANTPLKVSRMYLIRVIADKSWPSEFIGTTESINSKGFELPCLEAPLVVL